MLTEAQLREIEAKVAEGYLGHLAAAIHDVSRLLAHIREIEDEIKKTIGKIERSA